MSGLPWFKCNPADLLDGLLDLPSDEQGPYMTALALIYVRGGPLPDDARWLAGNCRLSVRRWNVVRAALIVKGKLYLTDDGRLMNARAAKELAKRSGDNPEIIGGSLGDNQGAPEAEANKNKKLDGLDKERELEKKSGPKGPCRPKADPLPVRQAFDDWNALAARLRLPIAKNLSDTRRKQIKARLTGVGIAGWREALSAVEASPLCRGENDRGWAADLDFVCQPKSFNKLREGSYAPAIKPGQSPPRALAEMSPELIAARRALLEQAPETPNA